MSFFLGKTGQLKIAVGKVADLDVEVNTLIAVRIEGDDSEGTTGLQRYVPGIDLKTSFQFAYDGGSEIQCVLVDQNDTTLASTIHSLRQAVEHKDVTEIVHFEPRGTVELHLRFVRAPSYFPKWVTVQVHRCTDLEGNDLLGKIDPYCLALLDEEEIGKTEVIKNGGNNVYWENAVWDTLYHGEQIISFQVYDHDRIGVDDFIGETLVDVWEFLHNEPKPNIRGEVRITSKKGALKGRVEVSINFWDDPQEKIREQKPLVPAEVTSRKSSAITSASSSSISARSSVLPRMDIEEAKQLAEQAAKDAARAKVVADLASRNGLNSPDVPVCRREANSAAEAAHKAAEAANRAKVLVDDLRAPLKGGEADQLRQLQVNAAKAKDDAIAAAKNTCVANAESDAQKARDSAQRAHHFHNDTFDIACAHPTISQLIKPLQAADRAAREAAEAAQLAGLHADTCAQASVPEISAEAAAAARRTAHKARKDEEAAEQAYKKAKRLARKEEKIRQKRLVRQQELEELKRLEEAEARERARQAEHVQDLERRRLMISPADVNENRLYQGVTGYSYHNAAKDSDGVLSTSRARALNCCGSPYSRARGRQNSDVSLIPRIPKHELRGLTAQGGPLAASTDRAFIKDEEEIIFVEQEGITERWGLAERPWCWCFGCGCLKCCGEC